MHPSRRNHRAHALRHDGDVLLRETEFGPYVPSELVQVLDEGRHGRGRALLSFRTAVRPRVPREKGCFGQVQLVHKVRHAARMFMPAMQQDHGALSAPRPVAIKQAHAIVGFELVFFRSPWNRAHGGCCGRLHLFYPSARRTRLRIVAQHSNIHASGAAHRSHGFTGHPIAIHPPNTPNTSARSLLPNGPS